MLVACHFRGRGQHLGLGIAFSMYFIAQDRGSARSSTAHSFLLPTHSSQLTSCFISLTRARSFAHLGPITERLNWVCCHWLDQSRSSPETGYSMASRSSGTSYQRRRGRILGRQPGTTAPTADTHSARSEPGPLLSPSYVTSPSSELMVSLAVGSRVGARKQK